MKRGIAFVLFTGLVISWLSAQTGTYLDTGPLLYIQPAEPCSLYIDGKLIGETPLLLTDVSIMYRKLELMGRNGYKEIYLHYDPEIAKVIRYTPVLEPYYGYIVVETGQHDAEVLIDGEAVSFSADGRIKRKEGSHTLTVRKEGFLTEERTTTVTRFETAKENVKLQPAALLAFVPALPENTQIKYSRKDTQDILTALAPLDGNALVLAPGDWTISLEHPDFEAARYDISIKGKSAELAWDLHKYNPGFRLAGLRKDSIVSLDGEIIDNPEISEITHTAVGVHVVEVVSHGYLLIREVLELSGDTVADITLEYRKDPVIAYGRKKTTGWILAGSGLSLLAGGLIMNSNEVLIPAVSDYDTYSTLKYVSLGIAGTGLIALLIGGGIGISALAD
ncbi:MAG: PEGA domain-containing protein [Spirochaetales bacterium]|nr:PEGA domain-containing protein [Spirochaetales bacterium]